MQFQQTALRLIRAQREATLRGKPREARPILRRIAAEASLVTLSAPVSAPAAPSAKPHTPASHEHSTLLIAYMDALIDAQHGDPHAEQVADEIWHMLHAEDGKPEHSAMLSSEVEYTATLATGWTRLPAGSKSPLSGRTIRSQNAWFNPAAQRIVYAPVGSEPGQGQQGQGGQQGQAAPPQQQQAAPKQQTYQQGMQPPGQDQQQPQEPQQPQGMPLPPDRAPPLTGSPADRAQREEQMWEGEDHHPADLPNKVLMHLRDANAPQPSHEDYKELFHQVGSFSQARLVQFRNAMLAHLGGDVAAARKEAMANALRKAIGEHLTKGMPLAPPMAETTDEPAQGVATPPNQKAEPLPADRAPPVPGSPASSPGDAWHKIGQGHSGQHVWEHKLTGEVRRTAGEHPRKEGDDVWHRVGQSRDGGHIWENQKTGEFSRSKATAKPASSPEKPDNSIPAQSNTPKANNENLNQTNEPIPQSLTTPKQPTSAPPQNDTTAKVLGLAKATVRGRPDTPEHGLAYNVKPSDLSVDPERFQFKLHTDKKGVTGSLSDVKWDPELGGVLAVWRDPADGKDYVVNGHHRHELAQRSGANEVTARYLQADNAKEARAKGALINIAEGHGTAVDAAKFLRDMNMTPEQMHAKHNISLKGNVAADAAVLSKLSDPLFYKVTIQQLDVERAKAIATHLASDPAGQSALLGHIEDEEDKTGEKIPPAVVAELAEQWNAAPKASDGNPDLFGEVNDRSTFIDRARLKVKLRADLVKNMRDFATVSSERRAGAVFEAGNVLNTERNREETKKAADFLDNFDREAKYSGGLKNFLDEWGVKYANARNDKQRGEVIKQAGRALRDALAGSTGPAVANPGGEVGGVLPGSGAARQGESGVSGLPAVAQGERAGVEDQPLTKTQWQTKIEEMKGRIKAEADPSRREALTKELGKLASSSVVEDQPTTRQSKKTKGIGSFLNGYESGEIQTIHDLVSKVSSFASKTNNGDLEEAVRAFQREQADDAKLKGRGDMEHAEKTFLDALRTASSNQQKEQPGVAEPVPTGRTNAKTGEPPSKDKPITLVFGGSFSPIHSGHIKAAQDAKAYMEQQGYKVHKLVLAPSADKLLHAKLGDELVPLEHRTAMAKHQVKDIPGIEVSDGPGVEAQNFQGKLKRTQLADWAARSNPSTTIVNVTGEDAAPGSPKAFPSAYAGDAGTSHEGYHYLAMPRDMDDPSNISSGKIRKAIKEGKPIPQGWMHPDAEAYYRQHLANRANDKDKSPLYGNNSFQRVEPKSADDIPSMPGLSQEELGIEAKARQKALTQFPELRQNYLKDNAVFNPDGSIKSVVLNTDEWRDQFEGYTGTNAQSVHEPSSYANKKLLGEMLQSQKGKGNNRFVVYAGGGGSGKGTAIGQFFNEHDYPIRLDQVTDNIEKANAQFDQAKAQGFEPEYIFVDRPPEDAWAGVVGRAISLRQKGKNARTVPLHIALKANLEARKTALEILKTRPDILPNIIDNRHGDGLRELVTDRHQAIQYLEGRIKEDQAKVDAGLGAKLLQSVHDRHHAGEIPEDIARGLMGHKAFEEHKAKREANGPVPRPQSVPDNNPTASEPPTAKDDRLGEPRRPPKDAGRGQANESATRAGVSGAGGQAATPIGKHLSADEHDMLAVMSRSHAEHFKSKIDDLYQKLNPDQFRQFASEILGQVPTTSKIKTKTDLTAFLDRLTVSHHQTAGIGGIDAEEEARNYMAKRRNERNQGVA